MYFLIFRSFTTQNLQKEYATDVQRNYVRCFLPLRYSKSDGVHHNFIIIFIIFLNKSDALRRYALNFLFFNLYNASRPVALTQICILKIPKEQRKERTLSVAFLEILFSANQENQRTKPRRPSIFWVIKKLKP